MPHQLFVLNIHPLVYDFVFNFTFDYHLLKIITYILYDVSRFFNVTCRFTSVSLFLPRVFSLPVSLRSINLNHVLIFDFVSSNNSIFTISIHSLLTIQMFGIVSSKVFAITSVTDLTQKT